MRRSISSPKLVKHHSLVNFQLVKQLKLVKSVPPIRHLPLFKLKLPEYLRLVELKTGMSFKVQQGGLLDHDQPEVHVVEYAIEEDEHEQEDAVNDEPGSESGRSPRRVCHRLMKKHHFRVAFLRETKSPTRAIRSSNNMCSLLLATVKISIDV